MAAQLKLLKMDEETNKPTISIRPLPLILLTQKKMQHPVDR